jgi:integrase
MRVTEDAIRQFDKKKQRPAAGQAFMWDDLVSGFGVRFTPTATAFVVQWRRADGSKVRKTLARWPQTSVVEAREAARIELSAHVGPKGLAAGVQLRAAMRAWVDRQTQLETWRPRYRAKVDSIVRTYVEGEPNERVKLSPTARAAITNLGRKTIEIVTREDVVRVVDQIKRGTADQLMAIISSFYNALDDRGITVPNPARKRLRVTGGRRIRTRRLTDAEFLKLWAAFQSEGDPAATAFALLAYTGARRREVTQMRWSELDLDAATWTLPPERRKTGKRDPEPFVVHLHPRAVAMLRAQPELAGSPYVFWGRRDKRPFDFHHAMMDRMQQSTGVADWRLHDLRRYMRSGLAKLGVSQAVAEMCLGHVAKGGLVRVYDAHDYADEKRDAWQRWGDHLERLTCPTK